MINLRLDKLRYVDVVCLTTKFQFDHQNYLNIVCSKYRKTCDTFIFIDDFSLGIISESMQDFYALNNLKSLIKKRACYKKHKNPTYIELFFTNRHSYF